MLHISVTAVHEKINMPCLNCFHNDRTYQIGVNVLYPVLETTFQGLINLPEEKICLKELLTCLIKVLNEVCKITMIFIVYFLNQNVVVCWFRK